MENPSVSTKNNNSTNIETHVRIEMENASTSTNETHVTVEIQAEERSAESDKARSEGRILHRVPPQLRQNKNHIFDPVVLSLGPYHHNKSPNSRFLRVEEFKKRVLNIMLDPTAQKEFKNEILERVDKIRIFYGGLSVGECKDEKLAEMMLTDTCFLLYHIEALTGNREDDADHGRELGWSFLLFLYRDMYMLENQIPLWMLDLLMSLKLGDKDEREALLWKFLSAFPFADHRLTKFPWKDQDQEPLHLLEAFRKIAIEGEISSTTEVQRKSSQIKALKRMIGLFEEIFEFIARQRKSFQIKTLEKMYNLFPKIFEFCSRRRKSSEIELLEMVDGLFYPVTDLKRKGIHFGRSSRSLTDVRFNSYWFYGKLQLPPVMINHGSQVIFSNLIALEMSPGAGTDLIVLSYVNLMKSLIQSPKDVRELREKGILFSTLRNDEEVVKIFKEIDTYGVDHLGAFGEVKDKINKHCNNKGKTWMAELVNTKFRTPWTVIALLAAIFLLCLTFLQTYYTINPRHGN